MRGAILSKLERDVELLDELGLMDYSLIMGVQSVPEAQYTGAEFPKLGPIAGEQPYVCRHDGMVHAYYVGIIDFLQGWSMGKKVAHVIKVLFAPKPISTVEPTAYGEQFKTHFQRAFVADGAEVETLSSTSAAVPTAKSSGAAVKVLRAPPVMYVIQC